MTYVTAARQFGLASGSLSRMYKALKPLITKTEWAECMAVSYIDMEEARLTLRKLHAFRTWLFDHIQQLHEVEVEAQGPMPEWWSPQ